jgi:hypothetical protein
MKRYLISTISVLIVLMVTASLFAQPGGDTGSGERGEGPRAGARERRMRGIRDRDLDAAIAAIEKVLASLKKAKEIGIPRPEGGFRDMSEEDRAKMMEAMQKRNEAMQSVPEVLEQQFMVLKGGFQLRQELRTETEELQAIADSAKKENATETAKMVQDLIARRTKAFDEKMEKFGIRRGRGGQRRQSQGEGDRQREGGQRRGQQQQ